jgi:flavorubredoxin
MEEMIEKADRSDVLFIGSPTINQDAVKPVWDVLSLVSPIVNRGKLAAAFGSYGWSGEAVGLLNERMKGLKLKVAEPGFKIAFKPTQEDIQRAENFGYDTGKMI